MGMFCTDESGSCMAHDTNYYTSRRNAYLEQKTQREGFPFTQQLSLSCTQEDTALACRHPAFWLGQTKLSSQ